jgi:hypothetical protein
MMFFHNSKIQSSFAIIVAVLFASFIKANSPKLAPAFN